MKNTKKHTDELSHNTTRKPVNAFKYIVSIFNLATILIVVDYVSKNLALDKLAQPFQLFPGAKFQLEKNTGIAFSIAIPPAILIPLNLIIFVALIVFLCKKLDLNKKLSLTIISLMAAGATGNLFDRLYHGFVIDFISIGNFPVFNLADTFITVSVFLLIVFYDKIKRSN